MKDSSVNEKCMKTKSIIEPTKKIKGRVLQGKKKRIRDIFMNRFERKFKDNARNDYGKQYFKKGDYIKGK